MIQKIAKLEKIFNPKSIAFVGATDRPGSVGLGICKNLLQGRAKRQIFFVNPYHKKVLGRKTFPFITSIEAPVDLAIIAVPAKIVPQVVREACKKQAGAIIVISAGFAEIGKQGKALQDEILRLAKRTGIPLVGPNTLGIIRPSVKLNATFAPATPKKGEIAFVSQSGALIDSVIDRAMIENYGFSSLISYGNEADIELSDFLVWLQKDKETKVIGIYLEALKDGRKFMEVAAKALKAKPIVILKAGKTEAGQKAAITHTAALAGDYQIYSAMFKQIGAIEVETTEELFDSLKALAWQPRCKNGIGIITNGGGCGVLAADYCARLHIELPRPAPGTLKKLESSRLMHPAFSRQNPLDIVGDALSDRYKIAIEALLSQDNIYGLIVIQTLQIMTQVRENARVIIDAKNKWPQKPILAVFMGGKYTMPGIRLLEAYKIPNYSDPKRAAIAMKALIQP